LPKVHPSEVNFFEHAHEGNPMKQLAPRSYVTFS
jgi:hypothetical protein